jgi:hypothetical protein
MDPDESRLRTASTLRAALPVRGTVISSFQTFSNSATSTTMNGLKSVVWTRATPADRSTVCRAGRSNVPVRSSKCRTASSVPGATPAGSNGS